MEKHPYLIKPVLISLFTVSITVSMIVQNISSQSQEVQPLILAKPVVRGKVTVLDLGLHFATAILVPEPVSSVVVGDPTLFKVEHSEKEPRQVFVKPLTPEPSQSNLLISTTGGQSLSLLVRSAGQSPLENSTSQTTRPRPVHFLLDYQPSSGLFIDESGQPSVLIPETVPLSAPAGTGEEANFPPARTSDHPAGSRIELFLEEQKMASLPELRGNSFRAGISRIYEEDRQIYVLFSVVNPNQEKLELLPPQVQLAGTTRKKKFSASSEQLPVSDFCLSRRKLSRGERADGVAQFERPAFKQSHQSYLLQIAESGSVDLPVLIPIHLGKSTSLKEEDKQ